MTRYFFILMIALAAPAKAQKVHWAKNVIDYSSQLSPYAYAAREALGEPDVFPEPGDHPNAWMPAYHDTEEYIIVGFEPLKVRQIIIAESYNPSSVKEIYTYDGDGNKYLINTFTPKSIDLAGRLLTVHIEGTDYEVHGVKLVVDGAATPGYSGIDAIGISDSDQPVELKINVPPDISPVIQIEKLSLNVNSEYEELRPVLSPNGKMLFFTRKDHPGNVGGNGDEDIWYVEKDETTGGWGPAINIGPPLNTPGPNYIGSIAGNETSMIAILGNQYKKNGKLRPGVSVSTFLGDGWSEPQALKIKNAYITSTDASYFLSADKKILLMAIERFDVVGGKDIYVSFAQGDGEWSEPLNLGPKINTAHDEDSPFLAADNRTLYFSSKGFRGYGKSDVYVSRLLDNTWENWTTPENLGSAINSEHDDFFFHIDAQGEFAYLSKGADIHRVKLPIIQQFGPVIALSGQTLDAERKAPVQSKISWVKMPEREEIALVYSDQSQGAYQVALIDGMTYAYTAEAEGYIPARGTATLSAIDKAVENIFLTPAKESEKTEAPALLWPGCTVYFDFDDDGIRKEYLPCLQHAAKYLLANPGVSTLIEGYADQTGAAEYNKRLSQRRAESVRHYLVGQGIDANRIQVAGMGELMSGDASLSRKAALLEIE